MIGASLIPAALAHNQFFAGTAAVGAIAGVLTGLRKVPGKAWGWCYRRFVSELEITSDDESYLWFKWFFDHHPDLVKARSLLLTTSDTLSNVHTLRGIGDERETPKMMLSPAVGINGFRHRGRRYWLNVDRTVQSSAGGARDEFTFGRRRNNERFLLRTLLGKREDLMQLVHDVYQGTLDTASGVRVYTYDYGNWAPLTQRAKRSPESLIAPGRMLEETRSDLERFLASREWYEGKGTPWRRGYLLSGPPGSGKSSFVFVLASLLGLDVYLLDLSQASVNSADLTKAMNRLRPGAILLIEEIDTLYHERDRNTASGNEGHVSFGAFLNALDGIACPEGRILFMTTNHAEKLNAALIRPGRVDVQLHFTDADADQAQRLFQKFFPNSREEQATAFACNLPDHVSMAALQEHCLRHRDDPERAIRELSVLQGGRHV